MSHIVALVVGAGLIGANDVLSSTMWHQRSLCCRLDLRDGRSLFVKCATHDVNGRPTAGVAREGRLLGSLRGLDVSAPAARLVIDEPDQALQVVVTDFLIGYEPLNRLRSAGSGCEADIGAALGDALARLHQAQVPDSVRAGFASANPYSAVLAGYLRLTPRRYADLSPAGRRVAACLQSEPLATALHDGESDWEPRALVHGDVKSDNVLVLSTRGRRRARLVDWELAGYGDPDADIGSLVGDAYSAWLGSIDFTTSGTLADWVATARIPLPILADQTRSALTTYRRSIVVPEQSWIRWNRYAGLFLIHRACAAATRGADLTPRTNAFLQVATQLVLRPEDHRELIA